MGSGRPPLIPKGLPLGTTKGPPQGSPLGSPKGFPQGDSPQGPPLDLLQGSPQRVHPGISPRKPSGIPPEIPLKDPRGIPQGFPPQGYPQGSLQVPQGSFPVIFPREPPRDPPSPAHRYPQWGTDASALMCNLICFLCIGTALRCAALHRTAHCTERTALPRIACTVRGCRADLSAHLFSHLTCGRRTRPSPVAARPTHQSTQPPIHPPVHPPIRRSTNPPPPQLMTAWL